MQFIRLVIRFFKNIFKYGDKLSNDRHTLARTKNQRKSYRLQKLKTVESINYIAENVDDLPDEDKIRSDTIYIVGENYYVWLAAFKCPCGCDELIHLNLLPEASPCWRIYYENEKLISIFPSIVRQKRCKSHFTINRGRINWWVID